ncbi:MAG: phytanoyl-CoA dioxygenase family protein, partial [Cyanobacteria bacterium P01_H01_bin.58]
MKTKTRVPLTTKQIEQFHRDGYLVVENLFDADLVERLIARFDPLFAGEFETGIYPDEWHWNPYLGKPGSAGQLTGGWKSDRTLATAVTSAKIGQMAA